MVSLGLKRKIKDLERFREIVSCLAEEEFHYIIRRIYRFSSDAFGGGLSKEEMKEPERVRHLLERLGPSFVKLGQLLSLRTDLIPHEYVEEFRLLQDEVEPISYDEVEQVLAATYDSPLDQLFDEIEEKPVSAASVSQVHRATLVSGEDVVVKVRRPGIVDTMEADIDIMEYVAEKLEQECDSVDPVEIVEEFKDYTERELDFTNEKKKIQTLYDYFDDWDDVILPSVYAEYCTEQVIVMSYIDGIKLTDHELVYDRFDTEEVAKRFTRSLLFQIFDLGTFHADPHPGNILAVNEGQIAYLDLGITGQVSSDLQRTTLNVLFSLTDNDADRAVDYFLELCSIPEGADTEGFRDDAEGLIAEWHGKSLQESRFTTMVYSMIRKAIDRGIEVPADVILLAKSLVTMEGTEMELDPGFNISTDVRSTLERILMKRASDTKIRNRMQNSAIDAYELASNVPVALRSMKKQILDGKPSITVENEDLSRIEHSIRYGSDERSLALVSGAFFIGSSVLAALDAGRVMGIRYADVGFTVSLVMFILFVITYLTGLEES